MSEKWVLLFCTLPSASVKTFCLELLGEVRGEEASEQALGIFSSFDVNYGKRLFYTYQLSEFVYFKYADLLKAFDVLELTAFLQHTC